MFVVGTLKPEWLRHAGLGTQPNVFADAPASASSAPHEGLSFAAHEASPAVVSITASKAPKRASKRSREAWRRYHEDLDADAADAPDQFGLGSGVIVSEQGYLLTNNHVIEGASDIEVLLNDGRQARATLVGTDPETDLAVLKINLDRLPVIRMGNADNLQVGDAVLAIGNPFNVGQTVTSGIVSALGRNQLGISTFENFIQTDAAINPGNSGGALVDAQGRLVGINSAIYSRSGGSLGIGFAISLSTARTVMDALLRDGEVARGWIGVQTRELTPEFAKAFKLPVVNGVLVSGVLVDAPAAKAGIKPGDVVTKVGERAVQSPAQLLSAVSALKPKSQTTIAVMRGAKPLEFQLQVAQRPRPKPEDE
jgi:serine protease DegQ